MREWLCSSDADRRDKLLACGALIVAELRMHVLKETEFTCSAGIAHNKVGGSPHFFKCYFTEHHTSIKALHFMTRLFCHQLIYNFDSRCWPNLRVV